MIFVGQLCSSSTGASICGPAGTYLAYEPVIESKISACFFYEKPQKVNESGLSREPPAIVLYAATPRSSMTKIGALPYPGSTGRIQDVIFLDLNSDGAEEMVVIHSADAPSTWEVIDRVYDPRVFLISEDGVAESQSLSRALGLGGDQINSHDGGLYVYPYKDQASIQAAVDGVVGGLMTHGSIQGTVNSTSFFYTYASVHERSGAYVIEGDPVTIEDTTAGWCKAKYQGETKQTTGWLWCDSIDLMDPRL